MPLARPNPGDTSTPPPVTIDRAQLAGMSPGEAHEAILGALDAGVIAATNAAGMIDQAIIDAAVAGLADTRKTIRDHAPYSLTTGTEGVWCMTEGADGTPWPCPTYRAAADTIADGLGR